MESYPQVGLPEVGVRLSEVEAEDSLPEVVVLVQCEVVAEVEVGERQSPAGLSEEVTEPEPTGLIGDQP